MFTGLDGGKNTNLRTLVLEEFINGTAFNAANFVFKVVGPQQVPRAGVRADDAQRNVPRCKLCVELVQHAGASEIKQGRRGEVAMSARPPAGATNRTGHSSIRQADSRRCQPAAAAPRVSRRRAMSGRVAERRVDVGMRVRAGDVLARIEDTEQRPDVDVAKAALESARATVKQKTLTFERYKALLQSRAIAQSAYDQARQELVTAPSALDAAEATLATNQDALSYTELKADAEGFTAML